jgi:hypothetical protein
LKLLIADRDEQYAAMLMRSIRQSDYKDQLIVSMRTDLAQDVIDDIDQYDVMLLDSSIYRHVEGMTGDAFVMILSEHAQQGESSDAAAAQLYKYQSVNSLLGELMEKVEHHSGVMSRRRRIGESECRIVCVYAASGGLGKTTTAVGLSELLATAGYRVFYLNTESIPSQLTSQARESPKFCRILYQLKKGEVEGLRSLWFKDTERGFDTFPLPDHDQEWAEFRGEDIRALLDRLRAIGQHDYIVIDMESALSERTVYAIEACDDLVWLIRDDADGRFKAAYVDKILRAQLSDHLAQVVRTVMLPAADQTRKTSDCIPYMKLLGVEVREP